MTEFELYESGLSIPEVSNETGIARSTLRFRFKKKGILRSRTDGVRKAASDGRLGSGMRGKKRIFTEDHKRKISESKIGTGLGYRITSKGYKAFTTGENKDRLEHVLLVEKQIGRKLFSDECVHHKDHDKLNNSLDNLKLMKRSEHSRHHALDNNHKRERDYLGRYK